MLQMMRAERENFINRNLYLYQLLSRMLLIDALLSSYAVVNEWMMICDVFATMPL